jgi:hypothetical protein
MSPRQEQLLAAIEARKPALAKAGRDMDLPASRLEEICREKGIPVPDPEPPPASELTPAVAQAEIDAYLAEPPMPLPIAGASGAVVATSVPAKSKPGPKPFIKRAEPTARKEANPAYPFWMPDGVFRVPL